MTKSEAVSDAAATTKPAVDHRWRLFAIVSILSLIADQATKIWARGSLPTVGRGCEDVTQGIATGDCHGVAQSVIESFWHWRLSMNRGSAFGFLGSWGNPRLVLSVVGIVAVIGMFWMLRKSRADQRVLHWALALVAGGAVGNLIDRIYYGVVTDFILWHVGEHDPRTGGWAHEWPVFNIADIVLVVGVGLMFIDMHKESKREKALKKAKLAKAGIKDLVE
ncbi:MAG: signal peptidase II [Kofleriaceae bacterium]